MSLWSGQAFTQGAAGHWMQRFASRRAAARSKPRQTSSQLWMRTSGACLGIGCGGILSRSFRSTATPPTLIRKPSLTGAGPIQHC
jgi:hypothetical protein